MDRELDPEDLNRRKEEIQRKMDAMREELKLTPQEFEDLLDGHHHLEDPSSRDDLNDTRKPCSHEHLICRDCGAIVSR
jgi:hypothetical protein